MQPFKKAPFYSGEAESFLQNTVLSLPLLLASLSY